MSYCVIAMLKIKKLICLNSVFSNDLGMVLPKQIYGLMEFNIAF